MKKQMEVLSRLSENGISLEWFYNISIDRAYGFGHNGKIDLQGHATSAVLKYLKDELVFGFKLQFDDVQTWFNCEAIIEEVNVRIFLTL
jgi:hypothetical protein